MTVPKLKQLIGMKGNEERSNQDIENSGLLRYYVRSDNGLIDYIAVDELYIRQIGGIAL